RGRFGPANPRDAEALKVRPTIATTGPRLCPIELRRDQARPGRADSSSSAGSMWRLGSPCRTAMRAFMGTTRPAVMTIASPGQALAGNSRSIEPENLEHVFAQIGTPRDVGERNLPAFTRATLQR